MRPIAPLGIVPWDYNDIYDQLRLTADLVGKQAEAEDWIQAYEGKVRNVRRAVASYFGRTETIAAIRFVQGQLRVYGARNMGHELYRSLGLTPPDRIRSQLKNATFVWEAITAEQLPDYASADRLFLLTFTNDVEFVKQVEESSLWKNLPAVKNGRVYTIPEEIWFTYDPLSIDRQLDDAISLLSK
ncbi:ABC transporter substrate-binding protein [Paenibacillus filicis]|uniref:ABC transporter substrate-binding protein n=1 Tax=Paenibacillus filicis TaxID=669464 RepID=A0ABU9DUS9_9BACL